MLVQQSEGGKPSWLSAFMQISQLETLQNVTKVQLADKTIEAWCFPAYRVKLAWLSRAVGVEEGVFWVFGISHLEIKFGETKTLPYSNSAKCISQFLFLELYFFHKVTLVSVLKIFALESFSAWVI